jgi:predicted cation transporter
MRGARSMMAVHHGTPLVVRASLPRTFLGLGIFVVGCLVFTGMYLLSEALKRPLEARQEAVITAGVLLALATILLFYLVRPKRRDALASEEERGVELSSLESQLTLFGESVQARQRAEQDLEQADQLPGPM